MTSGGQGFKPPYSCQIFEEEISRSMRKKINGMCDTAHPMGFKLHTGEFLNSSGLFNQSKVSLPKLSHQQVFLPSAADYQRTRTVHALHQIHQFLLHNFC